MVATPLVARQLVLSDAELEKRMKFETCDIVNVKEKEGGILLVRSANGARAFLYPVVEEHDLIGFELLSIFHPTNDVINSVILVRKPVF
ncbi:PREDICTED: probable nicotianamine synthase 4 [Populus euphratica]|uniref:Nicotianamine synthase n=1 Tax=Populus euphratica TaxID=75702 RepID=A0AAJ6Y6E4_POPEU|nr:PREDICTED: probable nicotianamine synthase 4 [Populus euphratica]